MKTRPRLARSAPRSDPPRIPPRPRHTRRFPHQLRFTVALHTTHLAFTPVLHTPRIHTRAAHTLHSHPGYRPSPLSDSLHLRPRDRLNGGIHPHGPRHYQMAPTYHTTRPLSQHPDGSYFPIHKITEPAALTRSIAVHTRYVHAKSMEVSWVSSHCPAERVIGLIFTASWAVAFAATLVQAFRYRRAPHRTEPPPVAATPCQEGAPVQTINHEHTSETGTLSRARPTDASASARFGSRRVVAPRARPPGPAPCAEA